MSIYYHKRGLLFLLIIDVRSKLRVLLQVSETEDYFTFTPWSRLCRFTVRCPVYVWNLSKVYHDCKFLQFYSVFSFKDQGELFSPGVCCDEILRDLDDRPSHLLVGGGNFFRAENVRVCLPVKSTSVHGRRSVDTVSPNTRDRKTFEIPEIHTGDTRPVPLSTGWPFRSLKGSVTRKYVVVPLRVLWTLFYQWDRHVYQGFRC